MFQQPHMIKYLPILIAVSLILMIITVSSSLRGKSNTASRLIDRNIKRMMPIHDLSRRCLLTYQNPYGPSERLLVLCRDINHVCVFDNNWCDKVIIESHVSHALFLMKYLYGSEYKFFDIGSNFGLFSILGSKIFNSVVSIEYQSELNAWLRDQSLENVVVTGCGIGERPKQVWRPDGSITTHGCVDPVDMFSFDNALLKIDIDGYEGSILPHILKSKFKAMVIEVSRAGWDPATIESNFKILKSICESSTCMLTVHNDFGDFNKNFVTFKMNIFDGFEGYLLTDEMIDIIKITNIVYNMIILR